MFLPKKRPSSLRKQIRRAKCFKYRLPSEILDPIGAAVLDKPETFEVQVVASDWNKDIEESIKSLCPSDVSELNHWIEQAKAVYEKEIAPETVRDRIDPTWLDRVSWPVVEGRVPRLEDPKSQRAKAAQERQYDELGFGAFICLTEVYIDPSISRISLLFDALLDRYFHNHGFGVNKTGEGPIDYGIDQIHEGLAEHAD